MAFTVTTILAPAGATIPIVFVADGFKSTQLSDFDEAIDDIMAKIRTTAPFNTVANKGKFQWYKISTVSVDEGASLVSHPYNVVTPVSKNTYHKVYSNHIGLIHYCYSWF